MDFTDISNPANPLSPLNPLHPLNPLSPLNDSSDGTIILAPEEASGFIYLILFIVIIIGIAFAPWKNKDN